MKNILYIATVLLLNLIGCCGCDSDTKNTPTPDTPAEGGYLFAHMKDSDYGGIYYYISKDAKQWIVLNDDKTIEPRYSGHPDIIKGADGRYRMIGVTRTLPKSLVLWVSTDLVTWQTDGAIPDAAIMDTPGYHPDGWYSAPKLFYDADSGKYLITWHASRNEVAEGSDQWWSEMRTFYMTTADFKTYSKPARLFDFKSEEFRDAATIDAIIRKIGGSYYAVFKDERSNDIAPTGKTVLISKSAALTGPYSEPISVVTPKTEAGKTDNWHEAPTIVEQPDGKGWYIFAERYPTEYVRFEAPDIESATWRQYVIGIPNARHGVMVRITDEQYAAIAAKYGF